MNQFTGTQKERDLQVLEARTKLRVPKKRSLATAGNSVANAKEIILNGDGCFYGHNGTKWLKFGTSVPYSFATVTVKQNTLAIGSAGDLLGYEISSSAFSDGLEVTATGPEVQVPAGAWTIETTLPVSWTGAAGGTQTLGLTVISGITPISTISTVIDTTSDGSTVARGVVAASFPNPTTIVLGYSNINTGGGNQTLTVGDDLCVLRLTYLGKSN